ncbi:unnamed protein product, partial [Rotaria sp. Silwood2]
TLKTLSLTNNPSVLGVVLEQIVLIEIDLMGNQIGSTGAQYLADVLRQYPTLVRLRLEDNQIDDQGAQYLACVLENNIVNINNYFALISYSFIIDT